jgi:hypothetical protein
MPKSNGTSTNVEDELRHRQDAREEEEQEQEEKNTKRREEFVVDFSRVEHQRTQNTNANESIRFDNGSSSYGQRLH